MRLRLSSVEKYILQRQGKRQKNVLEGKQHEKALEFRISTLSWRQGGNYWSGLSGGRILRDNGYLTFIFYFSYFFIPIISATSLFKISGYLVISCSFGQSHLSSPWMHYDQLFYKYKVLRKRTHLSACLPVSLLFPVSLSFHC